MFYLLQLCGYDMSAIDILAMSLEYDDFEFSFFSLANLSIPIQ